MNKTKLWFGGLILFFIFIFGISPLLFRLITYQTNFITYNQTEHNSCHITVTEPTIILRMDDVRAYSKPAPYLIDETIRRDLPITLGVIPRFLEEDENMINYLNRIKTNPNIEIAQHGTEHTEAERSITEKKLLEGSKKIQALIGVLPITYIPPLNELTLNSREIISKYFRIISGQANVLKEGENAAEIGYTIRTYYYDKEEYVPTKEVVESCKLSLEKTNLCVVMVHPQEYTVNMESSSEFSTSKFEEYKDLLDELEKLDATFKNLRDIVQCQEDDTSMNSNSTIFVKSDDALNSHKTIKLN